LDTPGTESPRIHLDLLAEHGEGLIALSGGPAGPIGQRLAAGDKAGSAALAERLAAIFPGRFYIELQRHGLAIEDRIEPALIEMAYALELPLVATNDACFADRGMHEAHDALLCIAHGTYVSQEDRPRVTPEHYFKSAEEMRTLFADVPEAADNTLVIAERCAFMVERRDPMLPTSPKVSDGDTEAEVIRRMSEAGLERRLEAQIFTSEMDGCAREAAAAPYRERLDYELGVIIDMGFAGYFLIVADFIQWAKEHDIPVGPGRGSGAGSVAAWVLDITDLDPLRFGLLFERFLNPERVSMPDFDIDFCQDRRDEVIEYVQDEYGRDRVAQIITFGKLQARAVLRDVGRVLQLPYGQVDRLCKMVPNNPADPVTLQEAIDGESRLREARDEDPDVARLLKIALRLEGLYRHASTHAAGVVIGDRPLDELVPLYRDPRSDVPVTQYNMKFVEQAGLVKFDFLGLKTLTVLHRARELMARRGQQIDLAKIPLDDAKTFEQMSRGETVGVFQFESSGMRSLLRDARVDNIEDIIALVALYRPGPMENIPKYVGCKHGREEPEDLHQTITPVTKDTYGVIIYQEQVMQIAQVFAGYSLGQADILRRAMGKKIKAEMAAQRETFVSGAVEKGVDKARASMVFDLVDKFAGYGFNKAHSAGYALVAYQTAYLKANYPVEFLAASMTLDRGNTDKLNVFRQELDRLGIGLLQPDINMSGVDFEVEIDEAGSGAIRYALAAIKNVGAGAMAMVIAERDENGPFTDLFDFARRLDTGQINKRQIENLARAGAFDCLDPSRSQVVSAADLLLRHANVAHQERTSSQVNLFGEAADEVATPPLPVVADWPMLERLHNEFQALGFYLSAHPLDAYGSGLAKIGVEPYADIIEKPVDRADLAGVILAKQERNSARGRYAFVQMSDQSGMFEITVFSEQYARVRDLLEPGEMVLAKCQVQRDDELIRLTAFDVEPLDNRMAAHCTGYRVFVGADVAVPTLKSVVERERNGKGRLSVVVPYNGAGEVEIELDGGFAVSPAARAALKAVPGVIDVHDL
jgi:DNA polymerase-3 subunit alpha